jgi:hypothetical protein
MTYLKPSFSTPIRLDAGTCTLSKVMKAVPLAHTPLQSICLQVMPGMLFSSSRNDRPLAPAPPVRTATVK